MSLPMQQHFMQVSHSRLRPAFCLCPNSIRLKLVEVCLGNPCLSSSQSPVETGSKRIVSRTNQVAWRSFKNKYSSRPIRTTTTSKLANENARGRPPSDRFLSQLIGCTCPSSAAHCFSSRSSLLSLAEDLAFGAPPTAEDQNSNTTENNDSAPPWLENRVCF